MATGLGSVDAYKLVTEWNTGTSSTTALSVSPSTFSLTDSVQLTAVVTGGGSAPTGTISFSAGDSQLGSAPLKASADSPTATGTITVSGQFLASAVTTTKWKVSALYSGNGVYDGSAGLADISLNLPSSSGSLVLPLITPNPVYQLDGLWPYTITLSEKAGVDTTLTAFTIDGASNIGGFSSTKIPAHGSITTSLAGQGLTVPRDRLFVFTGKDGSGQTWTQQLAVPFVAGTAQQLTAAITLTSVPATVQQNPAADPGCQWFLQLNIEETSGFQISLNQLSVGSNDFSGAIQNVFGTTRLAPYGSLQGTLCRGGLTTPTSQTVVVGS